MSDVNKQLLAALAQLDLAETEVINAKVWSAGEQTKKHCDFALTAIATARQAIAVPDGYALVPIEPTQAMLDAGQKEWFESAGADPSFDMYRAMLSAAQKGGK